MYCYLKAKYGAVPDTNEGLGDLKKAATDWFKEPASANAGPPGKQRKRIWADQAAELAKQAAEGPADEMQF